MVAINGVRTPISRLFFHPSETNLFSAVYRACNPIYISVFWAHLVVNSMMNYAYHWTPQKQWKNSRFEAVEILEKITPVLWGRQGSPW